MKIYFTTRTKLREFAKKCKNGEMLDRGADAAKRWVFVLKSKV